MRTDFGSTVRLLAFALLSITVFSASAVATGGKAYANSKYAGIVIDAKTGKTLYSRHADSTRYPASLTKMMTMYLMFEALESRRISKKTRIRFSKYAASRPPSKLGIKPGGSITAEQAIYALATKSANDVATAVAEHLGGSESKFATIMTKKARQLGMSKTTFKNASGLTAKGQVTTARDMAMLGIALREHYPQYYRYFSTTSFKYGKNRYRNHNRLLGRVKGVDGIKTGYTRASGYNLVSSVQKNKRSIVAVVLGGRSGKSRNAQMQRLISSYLPKASRRSKKRTLVASRKSSGMMVASAEIELPKSVPVPVSRAALNNTASKRINMAHTVNVASVATVSNSGKPDTRSTVDAIKRRLAELTKGAVPVPDNNPKRVAADAENATTTSVEVVRPVAALTTGQTTPAPDQWQIQIGATDSQAAALDLLSKARESAPNLLTSKSPYTETVAKNSVVLHRARFVGFETKSAARNACKALKKRKFACLALQS